jgi:fumarate reductase flavoprotein subunit
LTIYSSCIPNPVFECKELGVDVYCQSAVRKISRDKKGWLVELDSKAGETQTIKTGSVVIASGGYGGSRYLLKKYCPVYHDNIFTVGMPHTGDGLIMATDAGAATEGLGVLQLSGPGFKGNSMVGEVAQEPITIWVNKYGERFADESIAFDISLRGNMVDRPAGKDFLFNLC